MKVKVVENLLTTNSAGQVVESVPVYVTDEITGGNPPVVLTTDNVGGVPVRIVDALVAENSVGQPVDALPVASGDWQPI